MGWGVYDDDEVGPGPGRSRFGKDPENVATLTVAPTKMVRMMGREYPDVIPSRFGLGFDRAAIAVYLPASGDPSFARLSL
ncbi:MAG: hypothetical protein Fur0042_11050 [Cyanophyceae cyanobacterium]